MSGSLTLIQVIELQVSTFTALNILKTGKWLVATCCIHHLIRWSLRENVCQTIVQRLVYRDWALVVPCSSRFHFLNRILSPFYHTYVTLFIHHLEFAFETVVKLD